MKNALAHSATFIWARWGYSQERLLRSRVLQYCLDDPQPIRAPSADVYVADKQCAVLPQSRFGSYLEQPIGMGWLGRLGRT